MIANRIKALLFVTTLVAAFWEFLALGSQTPPSFDVVIAGGRIVDGTGALWFLGDVGITDGRIAAMGRLDKANAAERIDARGLVVAPGFIDMLGQSEFNILVDGRAASSTFSLMVGRRAKLCRASQPKLRERGPLLLR